MEEKEVSMFAYTLIFLLALFPFTPQLDSREIEEIPPGEESCVWFQEYRSAGIGRGKLTFFNACGKARYVYACLVDSFGEAQLLKSAGRVPTAGKVDFYPFIDREPRSVSWTSARNPPPIPEPC